jgi:hypothetical protein
MEVNVYNPKTQEGEAGRSQGQPGLHSKTLCQKKTTLNFFVPSSFDKAWCQKEFSFPAFLFF